MRQQPYAYKIQARSLPLGHIARDSVTPDHSQAHKRSKRTCAQICARAHPHKVSLPNTVRHGCVSREGWGWGWGKNAHCTREAGGERLTLAAHAHGLLVQGCDGRRQRRPRQPEGNGAGGGRGGGGEARCRGRSASLSAGYAGTLAQGPGERFGSHLQCRQRRRRR